jgi:hypothetical protein
MSASVSASAIDCYRSLAADDVPIDRINRMAIHDILDHSASSKKPMYTVTDQYTLFCTDTVCTTEMHGIYKTAVDKWLGNTNSKVNTRGFTTHDLEHRMGTSSMYTMETNHNCVKIYIEKYDFEEFEPNPGFSFTSYVSIIIDPKTTGAMQIEESNRLKIYLDGVRKEIVAKIRSINEDFL